MSEAFLEHRRVHLLVPCYAFITLMPSIEIACIGRLEPVQPPHVSFALEFEAGLKSHRFPSRFQADFDRLVGSLYHVGNPGAQSGAFNAYQVLSQSSRHSDPPFLEFDPAHSDSMRALLDALLEASPSHALLFTSDWQFGPEDTHHAEAIELNDFWRLHDARQLLLNAAYPIRRCS